MGAPTISSPTLRVRWNSLLKPCWVTGVLTRRNADQTAGQGPGDLASSIRSMNGRTQRDHIAPYSGIDADRPSHAVKRIPPVIRLLVMEIDDGTKDPRF